MSSTLPRRCLALICRVPAITMFLAVAANPLAIRAAGVVADFESASQLSAWTFGNGPEFPGARGSLVLANSDGSNCAQLGYDFTPTTSGLPPHYVTATTLVSAAQASGATRLRIKVILSSASIGARVRVVDASGQTLQYSVSGKTQLAAQSLVSWSVATIDFSKPGSYWAGANDGIVHAPITQLTVLLDATGMRDTGWLRYDNVELLGPAVATTVQLSNTTLTAPPATVGALADRVGVNIHFTQDDKALDLIKAAGVRWLRMDTRWDLIEQPVGTYNFTDFDTLVTAAEARSLHVLAILDYGHPVHTLGRIQPPRTSKAVAAYGTFCQAAAQHYKGRDVAFEIWNEPDIPGVWGGTPNVAEYGAVLRAGIDSVKTGNSSAIALTGGLSSPSSYAYAFWSELETRGAMTGAGGLGTHLYTPAAPETRWMDILQLKDRIARVMPGKALWCTEWGYSSTKLSTANPRDGHSSTARKAQASSVVRELLLGWWANLPLVIVYDIRDHGIDAADPEQNFGLLANDYTEKPVMTAVRTLLNFAKGRQLAGLMVSSDMPSDVHVLRLDGSSDKGYVVWSEETATPMTLKIPGLLAKVQNMVGQTLTTQVDSTDQTLSISATDGPVYVQIPN